MSPGTNVEVVREIYAALERGDADAVLARYDPDVEWEFSASPFRMVFQRTSYCGHDGIRAFIRERREEAWAEIFDHLDEVSEVDGHVVTVVTSGGRGRASGAEVARTHAALWSLRKGRVIRVAWFATREEALAAAGEAG